MSIVLTFFKKRGSQEADDFRGMTGYRGCPLNEWDYLTLDSQLKDIGVKLVVQEYTNAADLAAPYNTLVKKPICLDLRYSEGKSEQYPDKGPLTSTDIRTWILSVLKVKRPESLESSADDVDQSDTVVSREVPVGSNSNTVKAPAAPKSTGGGTAPTEENRDESAPQEIADQNETTRMLGLGLGLAGTLLVAAMAVAGGIGGSLLADSHDDDGRTEWVEGEQGDLFLIAEGDNNNDRPVKIDFAAQERAAKAQERARQRAAQQAASGKKAWEESAPAASPSVNSPAEPNKEIIGGDL